jgi:hypothetical protein
MMHRLPSTAAALLLAGCSHVPLTTIWKLATFDPARADPAVLRAALRHPDGLAVRRDGARLILTLPPAAGERAPRKVEFTLVPADGPGDREPRSRYARAGYSIEVLRLSDTDTEAVRKLQAERHASGGGKLEVSAAACHRGGLPSGPILASTYLRLDLADGYMPVVEDIDLRKELGAEKLATEVPPCP